jgi:hypothetical protein
MGKCNRGDIQFGTFDEVQQQIERALELIESYGVDFVGIN